jgi:hypothetical protein
MRYKYRLFWHAEYQKYAIRCSEFPTLTSLGIAQVEALNQVVQLVTEVIDAIGASADQPLPDPASENAPSAITRRPPPSARVVPRWRTRC